MSDLGNKVFISWSGSPSREIANQLAQWLEEVYDDLNAWVSDRDIEAGARSMQEIEDSLRDACAGIIVVTKANMNRPWINFEAGALSKALHDDRNRVIPLLVDFARPSELQGPMSILQAVMLDEEGLTRIMRSLHAVLGLDPARANRRAATYVDVFLEDIAPILSRHQEGPEAEQTPERAHSAAVDEKAMLPEMLEILRAIRDGDLIVGQTQKDAVFRTLTGNAAAHGGYNPRSATGEAYASAKRWILESGLEHVFTDVIVSDTGEPGGPHPVIVLVTNTPLPESKQAVYQNDLRKYSGVKQVRFVSAGS